MPFTYSKAKIWLYYRYIGYLSVTTEYMTNTTTNSLSFTTCLDYEERTEEVSLHFLSLLWYKDIEYIPYSHRLGQSLQKKGVDYIATILGKELWIDAKIRTYTGYDYRDIAVESKSLDTEKKKTDILLYITPNRDNITAYLIDLHKLRRNIWSITPLRIIWSMRGNEEMVVFSIEDLRKKNIATWMQIAYNIFARDLFSKN